MLLAYLDKQAQVDILGLGLGPVDLAILLVVDVDTLNCENRSLQNPKQNEIFIYARKGPCKKSIGWIVNTKLEKSNTMVKIC